MKRNRSVLSLALATFICATGGCTHPGDVIDTWEARSERVTIRVRKFDEKPKYILSQYYFSFDVQDRRSHEWRSVLMWMVDDPIPIQREQVKFVNDAIVYAFGNARFVVTTDAGRTWSEWDAKKAVPKPQAYMIDRVLVSDDGTGRMIVRRSTNENNGLAELATTDFGVHWTLEDERR